MYVELARLFLAQWREDVVEYFECSVVGKRLLRPRRRTVMVANISAQIMVCF